jgi:alcohol dehydrogenase
MPISAAAFLRSPDPAEAWGDRLSFDLAFDFTGHPDILRASLERLDVGGVAVWVGSTYPQPPVQLDAETVVRRLLTVRGLHNYTPADLLEAVRFMERQHSRLPFDALISGDFPLHAVGEAFRHAIAGNPHRVGIIP